MSESADARPSGPGLVVPPSVEAVIDGFNVRTDSFSDMDVYSAVCAARQALNAPTLAENAGAWSEVLAFGLTGTEHDEKPWGTYFGPLGSGTRDGEKFYLPDVRQADAAILEHWKARARSVSAPVLSARYNDLVWDLGALIAGERRDVEFARRAIAAYLAAARQDGRDAYDAFCDAERALALAIQINDQGSRDLARGALIALHRRAISAGGMWWRAFDAFEGQPKSGLTAAERDALIADLEGVLARCSDSSAPERFNPHHVEGVAKRLIAQYRRAGRPHEVKRLHLAVARAFEDFASKGNALLASMVLQTSMEAYEQAGMKAEAERILRLLEKSHVESVAQMTRYEHREDIPVTVVEEFLSQVVADTKEETFRRIAAEFLTFRANMEKTLKDSEKSSPLATTMPRTLVKDDRVVAYIGPINEDWMGHLLNHTSTWISLSTPWLGWALDRAKKQHEITAEDIAVWANRTGLFGDGSLLRDGVAAWIEEDHVKAVHVLVPQVEAAFRTLVGRLGTPTTKPHPQMPLARMVTTLGENLLHGGTQAALGLHGPDIVLHFRAFYADPRGRNLRNDLAHGVVSAESLDAGTILWVVHSLLLLGAWLNPQGAPPEDAGESDARDAGAK